MLPYSLRKAVLHVTYTCLTGTPPFTVPRIRNGRKETLSEKQLLYPAKMNHVLTFPSGNICSIAGDYGGNMNLAGTIVADPFFTMDSDIILSI